MGCWLYIRAIKEDGPSGFNSSRGISSQPNPNAAKWPKKDTNTTLSSAEPHVWELMHAGSRYDRCFQESEKLVPDPEFKRRLVAWRAALVLRLSRPLHRFGTTVWNGRETRPSNHASCAGLIASVTLSGRSIFYCPQHGRQQSARENVQVWTFWTLESSSNSTF